MRCFPLLLAFAHRLQLIGGNARTYVLPVRDVPLLIRRWHCRRQVKPEIRVPIALRYALANHVQHPQCPLRCSVALVGGPAIPLRRLRHIARHSATVPVTLRQMHLPGEVSLVRRLPVPPRRSLPPVRGVIGIGRQRSRLRELLSHGNLRRRIAAVCLGQQHRIDRLAPDETRTRHSHQRCKYHPKIHPALSIRS